MTDVVVDRLRIRGGGAHGRRLAGIAARLLPAALERACADLPDAVLGRLAVTLDLDPADYDDETLATLWASRIRVAAIDAGARPAARGVRGSTSPGGAAGPAAGIDGGALRGLGAGPHGHLQSVVRLWLASGEVPPGSAPWLRVLASPVAVAGVVAGLRPAEVGSLHALLAGARRRGRDVGAAPGAAERAAGSAGAGGARSAGGASATGPAHAERRSAPAASSGAAPEAGDAGEVPAARRLAAAAAALLDGPDSTGDAAAGADIAGSVTTVAGLVLLYPWLVEHCDRACALHPSLDPVAVRRVALARLADPEQPWLVDDPIVLILAGAPRPGRDPLAPLPGLGEVDGSAVGVLSSFSALLPGFARSTPGYVRAEWIARLGLLDTDADPVRLAAEPRPLDLVLPRLPYPLGLLRLPWSPVVSVSFTP